MTIKMKLLKLLTVVLPVVLLAATATAQTAASGLMKSIQVSGFVDGYATWNFNTPASEQNQLYNFNTTANSFAFNLAEVKLTKATGAPGTWGFTAALGYGPAVQIVQSGDLTPNDTSLQNLLQAYGSYKVSKGLQIDFGKFATPLGAEVIETNGNWNYSRSILFSYAIPFNHTGIRATETLNSKWSVYGMVVNGWNNVTDNNTSKTLGAGFSFTPSSLVSVAENVISGPEGTGNNHDLRTVSDTIVTVNPSSSLSFMGNYDFGEDKTGGTNRWQGVAGYIHYAINTRIAITPRVEWYSDPQGFTTGVAQQLREATLTLEYKAGDHAMTRAEYRVDHSNTPFFSRGSGSLSQTQATATLGLILMF